MIVVRIKERNQWVVRDALYEAWRSGQLNVPCDDNGQPITIPPVKSDVDSDDEQAKIASLLEVSFAKAWSCGPKRCGSVPAQH